jgi:hypothetical protein
MKNLKFWAILAISVGLISCNSDNLSDASLTATAQDEAQVSAISDDVLTDADEYVNTNLTLSGAPSSEMQKVIGPKGGTVTVVNEGNPFPRVFTIDYGTEGVTGKRGNVFKGKIIVRVTNRMDEPGSSRNYSFINFSVNNNQVKGTKSVTYEGEPTGKKIWTVVVSDTIVKAEDGKMIVSKSTRIRTRISDGGTSDRYFDDSYSIEGSASGINAKGVAYTMEIKKPLIIDGVWPVFVEGTMVITTEKRSVVFDYGDGTRDLKATATVDGVSKTISLRK